jgi:hypothetical protein
MEDGWRQISDIKDVLSRTPLSREGDDKIMEPLGQALLLWDMGSVCSS